MVLILRSNRCCHAAYIRTGFSDCKAGNHQPSGKKMRFADWFFQEAY
jgi:hypothetical protein